MKHVMIEKKNEGGGLEMSLQFLIGKAGTGKSSYILQEIASDLKNKPLGDPLLYLVPEQMTFQAEYELSYKYEIQGFVRTQVYSFTRLAWKILQEVGGFKRTHITEIGMLMLLRKIVDDKKGDFSVFTKSSEGKGFLMQVETLLSEFRRYKISPKELMLQLESGEENDKVEMLRSKMQDICTVYDSYMELLLHQYIDSEDYLRLLSEKMAKSEYIKNATIYIDGFYNFTPQELEVIENLLVHTKKVVIALTLDKEYNNEELHELQLFRMTAKTYQRITNIAIERGIAIQPSRFFTEPVRYKNSRSLAYLEENYDIRPVTPYEGKSDISIFTSTSIKIEVEGIARRIQKLVSKDNVRYRDITVVYRNSVYTDYMKSIFADALIPFHVDEKKSMLHHPLIEFIRSVLDILVKNWRMEDIFRAVKTNLFTADARNISQNDWDAFENYCISYGQQGNRWRITKPWGYRRYTGLDSRLPKKDEEIAFEKHINELRDIIQKPILKLEKDLQKATNVKDMCFALYEFVNDLQIPSKLEAKMNETKDILLRKEHEQAWKGFCKILDEFVQMMGDETISIASYQSIMEAGFEKLEFVSIPSTIDQVSIASFDLSRFAHVKYLFLCGVNEGTIPKPPVENGMISEIERELLESKNIELAPNGKMQLLDDYFYLYTVISQPQNHLYLSYSSSDGEGKGLVASSFISRIKEMFPNIEIEHELDDLIGIKKSHQEEYITHKRKAVSLLGNQLSRYKQGYTIENHWFRLYNYLLTSDKTKAVATKVLDGLFYENIAKQLTRNESEELYGKELQGSVSRLEKFYGCAFQHFSHYGLRLRDRERYKVQAFDIGQLFHAALKKIGDTVLHENKSFKQLSDSECDQLAKEAIDSLAPLVQKEVFLSSERLKYMVTKLEKVVRKTTFILREQAKQSGFDPVGLEVSFGPKEEITSFPIPLSNGGRLRLRGQVDRVDKGVIGDKTYLRIVDYKSSDKQLELDEVYYGLSLQMLTYLDVVISNSKKWLHMETSPAGVLYFKVHNPFIDITKQNDVHLETEMLKQYKMKGLLLRDKEVITEMDHELKEGSTSLLVPARLSTKGEFIASGSRIATGDDFDVLRKFVRKSFSDGGSNIVEGITDINPFKYKNKVPCDMCDYRSVCQFDSTLSENQYRILPKLKGEEALEKMTKEVTEDEES